LLVSINVVSSVISLAGKSPYRSVMVAFSPSSRVIYISDKENYTLVVTVSLKFATIMIKASYGKSALA